MLLSVLDVVRENLNLSLKIFSSPSPSLHTLCTMFVEPTTYMHAPTAAHHVNTCRNNMRDDTDTRASVLHLHANNARVDLHFHHSGARHELATSLYLAGGPNASQW